jgi:FKBP-type peptidyl-prolyl cis-trans isomerase
MKLALIFGLSLGLALTGLAADDASVVKTPKGKMSYGLGMDIGRNITNTPVEIDADALAAGIKAVVGRQKPLLSEQEATEAMNQFRTEIQSKRMQQQKAMQEKNKEAGEKNKKIGETFLAENKKKEGVKVTASGLQYKVLKQGTGKIPGSNDTVIAHYRGTLLDGTEFDSSHKRGEPGKFGVTRVIKGWTEALLMMPVGSQWQLFIPAELAYGESGRPSIPANSTLLFDIELIGIEGDDAKPK